MLFSKTLVLATAGVVAASPLEQRAICGEGPTRVCYGVEGGESQNLDIEDIKYVAGYLRYLGEKNSGDAKFWKMPKAIDCAEWTLPVDDGGSVLALAKHIKPRVNSAILYEDIANAIDGGKSSTDGGKNQLLGCGKNGGLFGVKFDLANPLYNTEDYKKTGATPDGIIIKLVKAPNSS